MKSDHNVWCDAAVTYPDDIGKQRDLNTHTRTPRTTTHPEHKHIHSWWFSVPAQ